MSRLSRHYWTPRPVSREFNFSCPRRGIDSVTPLSLSAARRGFYCICRAGCRDRARPVTAPRIIIASPIAPAVTVNPAGGGLIRGRYRVTTRCRSSELISGAKLCDRQHLTPVSVMTGRVRRGDPGSQPGQPGGPRADRAAIRGPVQSPHAVRITGICRSRSVGTPCHCPNPRSCHLPTWQFSHDDKLFTASKTSANLMAAF